MTELRPCPFCGGEAVLIESGSFVDVSCKDGECRGYTDYLTYRTKNEAVKGWNKRAGDTE